MCFGDDCNGDGLDRRSFLIGATVGLAGIAASQGQGVNAQTKQPETRVLDDPGYQYGKVIFKHNGVDTIDGYLARPKAEGVYPAVIVIAGNVITEEYIPNTCAALALGGFVGLAPNIFHTLPESAKTPEERLKALANHTDDDALLDIQAGVDYLRTQTFVKKGGIGSLGFCYGGRLAMLHGARSREVDAVVPYHPAAVTAEEIARLRSRVQIHSGTADRAVPVSRLRELEKIFKDQSTPSEFHFYEGADHGFLAYTRPQYNPDAARLSWTRTIQFLRKFLK